MPIILLRGLILLATSAIALWVGSLLLDDMAITWIGIVTASLLFTVLVLLLTPLSESLLKQYAAGARAFSGLIVAFVALLLTDLISDNLDIQGTLTWVLATLIVWVALIVVRAVFGMLFKKRLEQA